MAGPRIPEWRRLPMSLTELCIDTTLRCGQAFRWRKIDDEWHCTLQNRIISLKQDATHLHYRATFPSSATHPLPTPPPSHLPSPSSTSPAPPSCSSDDTLPLLESYFNLPISLASLYAHFSSRDANFRARAPSFQGIRILNQPSWEALVAFICSSNNHISRISSMVLKLCVHFGTYIADLAGEKWYGFPSPEQLAGDGVEDKLRELGFGYRARYIALTARMVVERGGERWLEGLRNNPSSLTLGGALRQSVDPVKAEDGNEEGQQERSYKAAHEALLTLSGVGPKVADCVCLMGLGWHEAVPVDTHVWQIATRDYKFAGGKGKSGMKTFNKAVHDAVGDHFRGIWGEYAGWAQSVLFTANLKSFAGQAAGTSAKIEGTEKIEEVAAKVEAEVVEVETGKAAVKVEKKVTKKAVKVEKKDEGMADMRSVMRVSKRKAVVKTEVKEEDGDVTTMHVEVTTRRKSKRRKVQV